MIPAARGKLVKRVAQAKALIGSNIKKHACNKYSTTTTSTLRNSKTINPSPFKPADRISSFGASIWTEMSPLAVKMGAVNLGQGFPDWEAPDFIKEAGAARVNNQPTTQQFNQYARAAGSMNLTKALAGWYTRRFDEQQQQQQPYHASKHEVDPEREVLISNGASSALFLALQAVVNPGDEVIIMEPFYDTYPTQVILSGAVPKYVPLRFQPKSVEGATSGDWTLDPKELEAAVTPGRTKAIILNTPHNPTGKVFSLPELQMIASLAIKHNLLVVSDEVYEHIVYAPSKHHSIAALPGMWDRTVTINGAGKTFSVTGWKIGWMVGHPELIYRASLVNQYLVFSVCSPLQEAVADAIHHAQNSNYFDELAEMYTNKRNKLMNILRETNFQPIEPQGTFFILADTSKIDKFKPSNPPQLPRDHEFCRWLTTDVKVAAIPPSAFYSPEHKNLPANLARFAFCKQDPVLEEAGRRLRQAL